MFDEKSKKPRSPEDPIEIRIDNNVEDDESPSRQLNETLTCQIDQSDETSPIDDLPESEEKQDGNNFSV